VVLQILLLKKYLEPVVLELSYLTVYCYEPNMLAVLHNKNMSKEEVPPLFFGEAEDNQLEEEM